MRCPYCGKDDTKVLESRSTEEGNTIRRRRECIDCSKRFTTYEKVEEIPLIVVKKDGSREVFDPHKILSGLIKACEKRPIPFIQIEEMVSDIERELRNMMEQEVSSSQVGEMIMEKLRKLDEVAYVRFASVYRQFKDINKFIQELESLLKEGGKPQD